MSNFDMSSKLVILWQARIKSYEIDVLYFTGSRPICTRLACTSGFSIQSRKACASALRSEFFITTAHCMIGA